MGCVGDIVMSFYFAKCPDDIIYLDLINSYVIKECTGKC